MARTLAWYDYHKREWERKAVWSEAQHLPGHKCYAGKQIVMWEKMKNAANSAWDHVLNPREPTGS